MVSVAASGNTLWVYDPGLVSYALDQPEMLRSPDYRHKCHAPFKLESTVFIVFTQSFLYLFLFDPQWRQCNIERFCEFVWWRIYLIGKFKVKSDLPFWCHFCQYI